MAFLGTYKLDSDSVVFYAQTSTPATGAETDADAVPSYRIYEEDTDAAILTGNMALLDDANTVGWYAKKIAITTAAGFEAGKSYAIRKRALMAAVPGAEFDTFRVDAGAVLAATQPAITWAQQKIVANVANEGALDIVNNAAQGIGQRNVGGETLNGCGQRNVGAVGQINDGSAIGQENNSGLHGAAAAYGQYNSGPVALYNEGIGATGIGIRMEGNQACLFGETTGGPVIDLQGYKAGQPVVRIEGNAVGTNAIDLVTSNGIGLRIAAGGATRDGISVLGGKSGIRAEGTAEYGIQAVGGTADLDPMPAVPGDAMDLVANAVDAAALAADAAIEIRDVAWDNVNGYRTLTQAASSAIAALTGSTLGIVAHVTYTTTLSGLTIPATWTKIWLTLKEEESQTDAESIIQIVKSNPGVGTDGLLYLNGAAATAGQASLTVNQAAGTIAIVIAAAATTLLVANTPGYDVKCLLADGTTQQLTLGTASITLTETRALA